MRTAVFGHGRPHHRRRLLLASLTVALAVAGPAVAPATAEEPPEAPTPSGTISLFDARAVGSIESFFFHAPDSVYPFKVEGGFLQATTLAKSAPQAFGYAGPAPVPLLTSADLVIPQQVPGTGLAIPKDIQDGLKSIDYAALPNYCQAAFPATKDGGGEAYCGGPAQNDTALGFNSASVNGHVKATGDFDQPLATKTLAESRGQDVTVPALQAVYHAAHASAESNVNDQGLPQGRGVAEFQKAAFLGSLVTLEDVRSETIVATDGTEKGTATKSTLTVGAASVFGVPVVITPDGVVVNKEALPNSSPKPLTEQLNKAMADAHGLSVRLIPASPVKRAGNEVTAASGSIEIAYDSQQPTPVRVVHRVAYSQAKVNALAGTSGLDLRQPSAESSSSDTGSSGSYKGTETSGSPSGPTNGLSSDVSSGNGTLSFADGAAAPGMDTAAGTAFSSGSDLGSPSGTDTGASSSAGLAASDVNSTGDPSLVQSALARPSPISSLSADKLTNVYVAFGFLAVSTLALFPLRRALMTTKDRQEA